MKKIDPDISKNLTKPKESKKSVVFVPTALTDEEGEITEIVTQVNIPTEGGWGWVVVMASFINLFILDGTFLTFGTLLPDIRDDFGVEASLVALINSVGYAMYFGVGPISSAVINKYGFRECAMTGSVISSMSLLGAYLADNYTTVLLCYGLLNGIGASLISLSACLVVGFYFEKLRALVFAIAVSGSSSGTMVMSYTNNYLVELAGWRITTLIHSGMFGCIYFLAMTYKPLAPLIVTKTTEEPAIATTNLPSMANIQSHTDLGTTERLFHAVSNAHFPTAAEVIEHGEVTTTTTTTTKPQPSRPNENAVPKFTLSTIGPGAISTRQLNQVKSVITQTDKAPTLDVTLDIKPIKKQSFWKRLCHWQKQVPEARPMYRDDIFYTGKIDDLPVYKKSVVFASKDRFPLEYHLAVTRAATADDIAEKHHIFPTAMRRVLATMFDPEIIKKKTFKLICLSCFCSSLGILVPYIFLKDRNELEGMPSKMCGALLSFMGFTSTIGRLLISACATKLSPHKLYLFAALMAAMASISFNFSFDLYYQFFCAGVYGFFVNSLVTLRTTLIVEIFGIEKLTNATGVILLFQGIAILISTPLASLIKNLFGYSMSFYVSGTFLMLCGSVMLPVKYVARREAQADLLREQAEQNPRKASLQNRTNK